MRNIQNDSRNEEDFLWGEEFRANVIFANAVGRNRTEQVIRKSVRDRRETCKQSYRGIVVPIWSALLSSTQRADSKAS